MRKLKRSIAHHTMEKMKIKKINHHARKANGELIPSFFSANWRNYLNNELIKQEGE